jgi:septal ring factor EnvC (AmiA/AmiB activator)
MRRLALLLLCAACTTPRKDPDPAADGLVEPDVFDVIRASNSRAAVEQLRERYHEEQQHRQLLEQRIGESMAAEEALSTELRERQSAVQAIRDEVRAATAEQDALTKQLEAAKAQIAELKKQLDAAQAERAAAEAAAKPKEGGGG